MSSRKKQQDRYHGLVNQGATCYLNSVLQVLFMTKDFREAVQRNNHGNYIDVQLASLFYDLKLHTAHTVQVTKKLGIYNVGEQRDAAEHFEKILSLTSDEAAKIFRGTLTHKTICSGCNGESDDDAAFWNLPLPLVNPSEDSFSVEGGIRKFFKDTDFRGDNQMYCDTCRSKCDATEKCMIKHHPEVLMLLLKRFEFSYQRMSYVKNSCAVTVPLIIKIPKNQMYELYAFVEHFGSLTGGHYTATIKSHSRENKWFCFNDSSVTLLNNQPFHGDKSERSTSAYLLFYRKKNIVSQSREQTNNIDLPSPKTKNNKKPGEDAAGRESKRVQPPDIYHDENASLAKRIKTEEKPANGAESELSKQGKQQKPEDERFKKQEQERKHGSLKFPGDDPKHFPVDKEQEIPPQHEQKGDRERNVQRNAKHVKGEDQKRDGTALTAHCYPNDSMEDQARVRPGSVRPKHMSNKFETEKQGLHQFQKDEIKDTPADKEHKTPSKPDKKRQEDINVEENITDVESKKKKTKGDDSVKTSHQYPNVSVKNHDKTRPSSDLRKKRTDINKAKQEVNQDRPSQRNKYKDDEDDNIRKEDLTQPEPEKSGRKEKSNGKQFFSGLMKGLNCKKPKRTKGKISSEVKTGESKGEKKKSTGCFPFKKRKGEKNSGDHDGE